MVFKIHRVSSLSQRFSVADRTHLLEDAFSLADAGELDYATALNITLYLGNEKHFSPWYVANIKLKAIDTLLSSTDVSSRFRVSIQQNNKSLYGLIFADGFVHNVYRI